MNLKQKINQSSAIFINFQSDKTKLKPIISVELKI